MAELHVGRHKLSQSSQWKLWFTISIPALVYVSEKRTFIVLELLHMQVDLVWHFKLVLEGTIIFTIL